MALGMPVVRGGAGNGIDIVAVEEVAEIGVGFCNGIGLYRLQRRQSLVQVRLIYITQPHNVYFR